MKPLRIAVAGALGRMGQTILRLAIQNKKFSVRGALEAPDHAQLGEDIGQVLKLPSLGVYLTGEPEEAIRASEVLITFSTPKATMEHLEACLTRKRRIVIGTTGFSAKEFLKIQKAAKKIAVVQSPNMSIGVNLLFTLTKMAASKLGPEYDIEIVEAHHRMKKDAPSGTALKLAEEAAGARGVNFNKMSLYGRQGLTGERKAGTIGIHALRGGDVVGEHTVEFMTAGERLGLFHKASSREAFAAGALLAAQFVSGKRNGLWSMQDVLGL